MNNKILRFLSDLSNEIDKGTVETLNFTKKEDVEKLENAVKTLKSNEFFKNLFGDDLFDTLLESAHKIYAEAHKNDIKAPKRPSLNSPENVKNIVNKLANEYVDTTIAPYVKDMTKEQKHDIIDSLFEFGCWIYNK